MDNFYVPSRYPNGHSAGAPFEHYGPLQSEVAIQHACEIIEFVPYSNGPMCKPLIKRYVVGQKLSIKTEKMCCALATLVLTHEEIGV